MAVHRIKKGLDLPISGSPEQSIHDGPAISRVALLGDDYPGLRARLHVEEGDSVLRGELLFEDRTNPGVRYTAPAAGRIAAINRGHRRVLQSVVIQLARRERSSKATRAERDESARHDVSGRRNIGPHGIPGRYADAIVSHRAKGVASRASP